MSTFADFDVEIADDKHSLPSHYNGSVSTAGTPVTITPSSPIQLCIICNPDKGTRKNDKDDVLLISIDGTTNYFTVGRGRTLGLPGVFSTLKIDSNVNGTNYEVIVWY